MKVQPEGDFVIDASMKQRCSFCGAEFEVNMTKSEVTGSEKVSGKIVSKGLLDYGDDDTLAFRVEPKVRMAHAAVLFVAGLLVVSVLRESFSQNGLLGILFMVSAAIGIFSGMLARRVGYSEVLTAGGGGVMAGVVLGLLFGLQVRGDTWGMVGRTLTLFGVCSVGSFAGGILAWILRRFFNVRLGEAEK